MQLINHKLLCCVLIFENSYSSLTECTALYLKAKQVVCTAISQATCALPYSPHGQLLHHIVPNNLLGLALHDKLFQNSVGRRHIHTDLWHIFIHLPEEKVYIVSLWRVTSIWSQMCVCVCTLIKKKLATQSMILFSDLALACMIQSLS